jgi:FkbM family methyltransferase
MVDAIEPEPFCRTRLEGHIRLNRCENIQVFPYALSDRMGTAVLHLSPSENLAKSSLREANVTMGLASASPGSLEVETRTLDEHVSRTGRSPDVLKVDVEGAELLVIAGGLKLLSQPDSAAILFEASDLQASAFGYKTIELKAKLVELGYEIFRYRRDGLEAVQPEEGHRLEDLVALRPIHRQRLESKRGNGPQLLRPR